MNSGNLNWIDTSGDPTHEPLIDVSDGSVFAPATVAGSEGGGNQSPIADAGPDQTVTDADGDSATVSKELTGDLDPGTGEGEELYTFNFYDDGPSAQLSTNVVVTHDEEG